MEGLHHDTIVDEEEEVPPTKEDGSHVEAEMREVDRVEDFSNKPINRDLTADDRVSLYEQMVGSEGSRNAPCEHINKVTSAGSCICT